MTATTLKTRRWLCMLCLLVAGALVMATAAADDTLAGDTVADPMASALAAIRLQLDDGDWDGSRAGLMQLVTSTSRESGPDGLKQLGLSTLDKFVGRRMLPAAVLHLDLYRDARIQRAFAVSTYSRQIYLSLVRKLVTGNSLSPQSKASLYALLADELYQAGVLTDSVAMYRRALDLDPGDIAATLSLAIRLEQRGLDAEAAEKYEAIVVKKPDHDEAALRLAILLGRLDKQRAKTQALQALVARDAEPRILAVAYEELAADRLREDGPAAARDLLRKAVARLPDQSRLVLQLAFVLDTLGERGAASKLLANLPAAARDDGLEHGSPRHLLALWTADDDAHRYERLRGLADEQIKALHGGAF